MLEYSNQYSKLIDELILTKIQSILDEKIISSIKSKCTGENSEWDNENQLCKNKLKDKKENCNSIDEKWDDEKNLCYK